MRRFLTYFGLLFVVLAIAAVGGFYWLRTSLPQTAGTISAPGLEGTVAIHRDANAVPYIFAGSRHDAYFALGYVHAQDRLWQMDFLRRLGSGRLSEILGERLVPYDKYIRTLGLMPVAAANFDNASPKSRSALSAYADGVNALLGTRSGALPPEFLLLGYEPEHWRPADSLLWSRLMAVRLGRNQGAERVRFQVARALAENGLPADLIYELWPNAGPDEPVTVAEGPDWPAQMPAKDSGSNGWIIRGSRTASGKPILANDPHLRFGAPVLWYLAHVEAPDLRVTGATVPGIPFTLLGHNGEIAWGMTNGGGDVEDLYVETVDPDDPGKYLTPDGPRPFRTRRETISIKDADPIEFTVRETRHGPVLSDLRPDAYEEGKAIALSTPALRGDDRTVDAVLAINEARDRSGFDKAARGFQTPHTNLFYASVEGDIGLVSAGRIPIRGSGNGFAPVPAAGGEFDWTGFIPESELPSVYNPSAGVIVNANNRIVGDAYPYSITRNWGPPYRADRIHELLERREKHDIASTRDMQMDILSAAARRLLPLMVKAPVTDDRARAAVALMKRWNYEMRRDRTEPLIYATWLRHLAASLIADEIGGPQAHEYRSLVQRPGASFVALALTERQHWCDDISTPDKENCGDRLGLSLESALDEITASQGSDIEDWRWGDLHRARFRHPVLTQVPVASWLADLSIATDGGDYTINRGMTVGGQGPDGLNHTDGAGYRAIYDLANLENSRFVIATGQSGNPLSEHYGDMMERWRDGDSVTISGSKIREQDVDILILEPQQN